jgi:hypothetical protein
MIDRALTLDHHPILKQDTSGHQELILFWMGSFFPIGVRFSRMGSFFRIGFVFPDRVRFSGSGSFFRIGFVFPDWVRFSGLGSLSRMGPES